MEVSKALSLFRGTERYNCAQAVKIAFTNNETDIIQSAEEFKQYGSGKAPNNICGALYAGIKLCGFDDETCKIAHQFRDLTGYITCSDLKSKGNIHCKECVRIAAELVKTNIS